MAHIVLVHPQSIFFNSLWPTFARSGLGWRSWSRNRRAAARAPSLRHMTMASPSSGARPSRFLISSLSSSLMPQSPTRCGRDPP